MDIQSKIDDIVVQQKRLSYWRWRAQLKHRGDIINLSIDEYLELWGENWFLRGRGIDDLCMTRKDWTAPWSLDNVELITRKQHFASRGDNLKTYGSHPIRAMEKIKKWNS